MSGDQKPEVHGIDNLTPFEYALAGVTIPEGHEDSPSLAVIEDMRRMAAKVPHSEITHPGLREFLHNGGSVAKRSDRRSARSAKSSTPKVTNPPIGKASSDNFIDITPIDLLDDDNGITTADTPAAKPTTPVVNEFEDTVPPVPAEELQALGLAAIADPSQGELPTDDPMADDDRRDLSAVDEPTVAMDIPTDSSAAQSDPEPRERIDFAHDRSDGPVESEKQPPGEGSDESEWFTLTRIDPPKLGGGLAPVDDTSDDTSDKAVDGTGGNAVDNTSDKAVDGTGGNAVDSELFPEVEDDPDLKVAGVRPNREKSSGAAALAAASPLFAEADGYNYDSYDSYDSYKDEYAEVGAEDSTAMMPVADERPVGILGPEDYEDDQSLEEAYAGADPIEKRRLGSGAVLVLGATMVASAAVTVVALWWAGGIGQRTETEAAVPESTTTVQPAETDGEQEPDAENEVEGSPSTLDMSQSGTTAGTGSGDDPDPAEGSASTSTEDDEDTTVSTQASSTGPTDTEDPDASTESTEAPASTVEVDPPQPSTPVAVDPQPSTTEEPAPEVPASTGPGALAYIGDSVNIGSHSGPPAEGAMVRLFEDPDRDGQPDDRIDTRVTGRDGRFAFNIPAACYVLQFYPLDGYVVDEDLEYQAVCLEPGEAAPRMDGILYPLAEDVLLEVPPPSGCYVEPAMSGSEAGVEVYENNLTWADSYTFYDISGDVVARTSDLGPPTGIDGATDWKWEADEAGFPARRVWRVAAVRNGVQSEPITCSR